MIRFKCEHCSKRLKVAPDKAGIEVKCPKCSGQIVIPTAEEAIALEAMEKAAGKTPPDNAFTEFAVFANPDAVPDSIPEVSATEEDSDEHMETGLIDPSKVAVSRMVIYTQGVLLGVLTLAAFLAGMLLGSAVTSRQAPVTDEPVSCIVAGRIFYPDGRNQNLPKPDEGAVVLLLPERHLPDQGQKLALEGFRPHDAPPGDDHQDAALLRSLGGEVLRVDDQGRFETILSEPGPYFFLVISRNQQRAKDQLPRKDETSRILRYFKTVGDLLGDQQYVFERHDVRGDKNLGDRVLSLRRE